MGCLSGQQSSRIFVPEHQGIVVALPYTTVAATPAARGGLRWWLSEIVACCLQALLELRNAPAHGCALGCVGVDDGVFVLGAHAVLSDKVSPLFVGLKSLSYGSSFTL